MMESGMTMMLRSMGFDAEGLKQDIQTFMAVMRGGVEQINANQVRIEEKLARIEKLVEHPGTTTAITAEDGQDTGILITTEKFPEAVIADVMNGGNSNGGTS